MPWKDPPLSPIYINPNPSVPLTPVPQELLPTIIWDPPVWRERFSLIVFAVIVGILGYTAMSGLVAPVIAASAIAIGPALLILMFRCRFRSLSEVLQKSKLLSDLHKLQNEIKQIENVIKQLNDDKNKLNEEEKQKVSEITSKQRECPQRENNEIDRIDRELQSTIANIDSRKYTLNQAEENEIANTLRNLQKQFLTNRFSQFSLVNANIPGISPELTSRLLAAGVETAADIVNVKIVQIGRNYLREVAYIEIYGRGRIHVQGIGPVKAQALLSWHQTWVSRFRTHTPQSLPSAQEAAIRSKYQAQHQSLNLQRNNAPQNAKQKKDAVRAKYQQEQNILSK